MAVKVLLVEDDRAIATSLTEGLVADGHLVDHVATGRAAVESVADDGYDMVLLDLGLPDVDGREVCRSIRQQSNVPIIMITARGDELDRVVGLELGADDYVTKPFSMREVLARIRAVARRTAPLAGAAPGPALVAQTNRRRMSAHSGSTVAPAGSSWTASRSS